MTTVKVTENTIQTVTVASRGPKGFFIEGSSPILTDLTASGNISASGNIISTGTSTAAEFKLDHTDLLENYPIDGLKYDNTNGKIIAGDTGPVNYEIVGANITFDSGGDIVLDAAGDNINFKKNGVTTADINTNTGKFTTTGDIAAGGTISAEHFYSSDDAEITDNLTVGGNIVSTGTSTAAAFIGSATGLTGTPDVLVGDITASIVSASGEVITNNITASNNLLVTNDITGSGNTFLDGTVRLGFNNYFLGQKFSPSQHVNLIRNIGSTQTEFGDALTTIVYLYGRNTRIIGTTDIYLNAGSDDGSGTVYVQRNGTTRITLSPGLTPSIKFNAASTLQTTSGILSIDGDSGIKLLQDSTTLPTSDPGEANQLFTQTAEQLGGSGTTKVLCVSAG